MRNIFKLARFNFRTTRIVNNFQNKSICTNIRYKFSQSNKQSFNPKISLMDKYKQQMNKNQVNNKTLQKFNDEQFDQLVGYKNSQQYKQDNAQNLVLYSSLLARRCGYQLEKNNIERGNTLAELVRKVLSQNQNKILAEAKLDPRMRQVELSIALFMMEINLIEDAMKWLEHFRFKFDNFQQTKQLSNETRLIYYYHAIKVNTSLESMSKAYNFIVKNQYEIKYQNRKQVISIVYSYAMKCHSQKIYDKSKQAFMFLQPFLNINQQGDVVLLFSVGVCYTFNEQLQVRGLQILEQVQKKLIKNDKNLNMFRIIYNRKIQVLSKLGKIEELLQTYQKILQFMQKDDNIVMSYYYLRKASFEYQILRYKQVKKTLKQVLKAVSGIKQRPTMEEYNQFFVSVEILSLLVQVKGHYPIQALLKQIQTKYQKLKDLPQSN